MTTKITNYLVYITIFLLPAYLVRFSLFGIPTNVLEILILAIFISCFFREMGKGSTFEMLLKTLSSNLSARGNFLKLGFRKEILLCFGLIFVGMMLSTLVNKNYAAGFGIIKSWFVLPLVFSRVAVAVVPKEERKNIFWAYCFSALAVATVSLGYYFSGAVTFDGRLQGIFNSPNYLAMYLAPGLVFGIWYLVVSIKKQEQKSRKTLAISGLSVILVAFYLTYSYAAWLAVVVSLASVYFIKNKKMNLRAAAVAILLVASLFVSQRNTEKFHNFEKYSRSSLESRVMIWQSASKILSHNIIFGIGPGNFQNKYLEYQKYFPPYLEWAVPHPHNLYLAWWLYGGMISFIAFILLIFFWFREMSIKEKNSLWAISFAIMLYFLLHGFFDTTYFKNDLALIFWLNFLLGLQIQPIKLAVSAIYKEKQTLI